MALALLHGHLLLRPARVVEQGLDVGHQVLLVQLPPSLHRHGYLVVLHDRTQLLLVNNIQFDFLQTFDNNIMVLFEKGVTLNS